MTLPSVSSVALLGLDPRAFRLVTPSEMSGPNVDETGSHADGSYCDCHEHGFFLCSESEEMLEADARDLALAGCF